MLFYEMRFSPWTVRNVLESFVRHYSYYDRVFDPQTKQLYDGGISFTHDMGVSNIFSPKGFSSYEREGLDRKCFSYMTHEQLVNWVLCAGVYAAQTRDVDFLREQRGIIVDCYHSMQVRDNPDPAKRTGVMSFESSRCGLDGGEITTYDSLDASLGQSRGNLYLAVKSWAGYLALEYCFDALGMTEETKQAHASSVLCAKTIVSKYDSKLGFIPAVFDSDSTSAIVPAIEGLIFPKEMGLTSAIDPTGEFKDLMNALCNHFRHILKKGVCLYDGGGWKLSSTADNSWMSKICLCQHVARTVLKIDFGSDQLVHDTEHMRWEIEGARDVACSDQFSSGVAKGSKYYPRIVTSILWMDE